MLELSVLVCLLLLSADTTPLRPVVHQQGAFAEIQRLLVFQQALPNGAKRTPSISPADGHPLIQPGSSCFLQAEGSTFSLFKAHALRAGGRYLSGPDTDGEAEDDNEDADSTVSELSTAPGQGQQQQGLSSSSAMPLTPLRNGISLSTSTSEAASLQVACALVSHGPRRLLAACTRHGSRWLLASSLGCRLRDPKWAMAAAHAAG